MRLVPNMTKDGTVALLKAHLVKHGFADVEVNVSGGYDPTETDPNSKLIQAQIAVYKKMGIEPLMWPRSAGSWPGVTFTGAPLKLPAGSFGLGHGSGAHAPDEYWIIESANKKVAGMDGIRFAMETVNSAFHEPLSLQTPRMKTLVRLQSKNCSPLRRIAA